MSAAAAGPTPALPLRRVLWFWVPLAAMWLLMNVEQPLTAAAVARLSDATRNLAAFGLAFSLAVALEGPIVMLLTAGNALAADRRSYRRLLGFTHAMTVSLTALHLAIGLTPLYATIVRDWIGAPDSLVAVSRGAFLLMLPCSSMVAYRRLWQGVLLRHHQAGRVASIMILRLITMILVLAAGLGMGHWPGAYVAPAAVSAGVTIGAFAAWRFARPLISSLPDLGAEHPLPWSHLLSFYVPLALTAIATQLVDPLLAYGMSHGARPLESLAVWPVLMGLFGILLGMGRAQQEVAVALLREPHSFNALRTFSYRLAIALTAFIVLLAITPLGNLWFVKLSGLDPELARLLHGPMLILLAVPALGVLRSWWRGVLIHRRRTVPVGIGTALNLGALLSVSIAGAAWMKAPGVTVAATAFTVSLGIECAYLAWWSRLVPDRIASVETADPLEIDAQPLGRHA